MDMVLKFIGSCTVIIFLLLALGLALARMRIRKALQGLGDLAASVPIPSPGIITLSKQSAVAWRATDILQEVTESFTEEGFSMIADYTVEEMPGLFIRAFVDSNRGAYGVHYELPAGPNWQDVYAEFVSGQTLTVTNAPQGEEIDAPPYAVKEYDDQAEVPELIARFDAHPMRGASTPASAERFPPCFESAYRRSMEWRSSRGGVSAEEIHRTAALRGDSLSEDDMRHMLDISHHQAMGQLNELLRRRLLESSGISALEWDRVKDKLLIIHDQMKHDDLCSAVRGLGDFIDPEDPKWSTPEGLTGRERFQLIVERLDRQPDLTKIWETDEPVPADFYEYEVHWVSHEEDEED